MTRRDFLVPRLLLVFHIGFNEADWLSVGTAQGDDVRKG